MKLKGLLKSLCILGLTLLPISFSNGAWNSVSCQEFTDSSTLIVYNNTILTFPNGNFTTNRLNNSIEHVAWLTYSNYSSTDSSYSNISSFFSWYNGKPYLFAGYKSDNYQGTPTNVCVESLDGFNITSFGSNMNCTSEDINSFLSVSNIQGGYICYPDSSNTYAYAPFTYCFYDSNNVYCFKLTSYKNSPDRQVLTLTNSLDLPGWIKPSNFASFEWESSPLSSSSQDTYYYSTGSCPSVGQLKAGSNLSPAVCYGGYSSNVMYGDQVAFQGGSGMTIFEIYDDYLNSFSDHSMNIQTWYDTYWGYYQNIARDSWPFEGLKKSYLGLQFARQTFGNTQGINGSYIILNYCYYVLNNVPDNQSTCVGSNVSTQYSGITLTDQDRKDLIDMVNDNYIVHRPGSGSIFLDPSQGLGGGGSSRGDEECSGIPCLFQKFYQMFTSSRVNDVDFSSGGEGILPGYIALAFVVVVLFYVFKR